MKKIESITVKNSIFFKSDFTISFSEKLNCLMGGRGTGKSTLLYFIKAAFDNEAEEDKIISSVLKTNLQNGTIIIRLEGEDGKHYEIEKISGEEPQAYTLPDKSIISLENLMDIFICDIYPSLKIEEIGKNNSDRLALIDKRITTDTEKLKSEIKKIQIMLDQNAILIRQENARISQIKEQLLNYKSAKMDLKKFKEDKPEDIKEKEQLEYEKADENEKVRNSEKRYVNKVVNKLKETQSSLKELNEDIQTFLTMNSNTTNFINKVISTEIKVVMDETLGKMVKDNEANIKMISLSISKIEKHSLELKNTHQKQQNDFFKLKQKFEKHKEYINRYNQLSHKVEEKDILLKEIDELESKRTKTKSKRSNYIKLLNERKIEIFNLRKKIVDSLNEELNGAVKITLTYGGITDDYENYLRNALRGSNLKYNAIIPYIVQNFTPDTFAAVVHEKDDENLKKVAEIDEARSKAIIEALHESEEIYDIESLYCEDLPEFYLKINEKGNKHFRGKENYKKSDDLSTGQRCTTVLPIVFAVSDNPLFIDQPEDNLDNKYITETIHKIIREQKEKRQLIFITHNPNIPVLSDAELNIFLNYNEKKSMIDSSGTIEDVKFNILNLLEGGKDAFDTRKTLYGE